MNIFYWYKLIIVISDLELSSYGYCWVVCIVSWISQCRWCCYISPFCCSFLFHGIVSFLMVLLFLLFNRIVILLHFSTSLGSLNTFAHFNTMRTHIVYCASSQMKSYVVKISPQPLIFFCKFRCIWLDQSDNGWLWKSNLDVLADLLKAMIIIDFLFSHISIVLYFHHVEWCHQHH